MTDQPDDDRDRASDPDAHADVDGGGRRSVWSRRIAVALLVTFAAFVLLNVAVVLALVLRSAAHGSTPFGH